jgi:hypothetical protein
MVLAVPGIDFLQTLLPGNLEQPWRDPGYLGPTIGSHFLDQKHPITVVPFVRWRDRDTAGTEPAARALREEIIGLEANARARGVAFGIIAHSWGNVLTHVALAGLRPDIKTHVDVMVSLGSPLGYLADLAKGSDRCANQLFGNPVRVAVQQELCRRVPHEFMTLLQYRRMKEWVNLYSATDEISRPMPVPPASRNVELGSIGGLTQDHVQYYDWRYRAGDVLLRESSNARRLRDTARKTLDQVAQVLLAASSATDIARGGGPAAAPASAVPGVSGRVTDAPDHGIPGIHVYACPIPPGTCGYAHTGADGAYTIQLPVGRYRVQFGRSSDGRQPDGYYSGAGFTKDVNSAVLIEVRDHQISGVDVTLPTRSQGPTTTAGPDSWVAGSWLVNSQITDRTGNARDRRGRMELSLSGKDVRGRYSFDEVPGLAASTTGVVSGGTVSGNQVLLNLQRADGTVSGGRARFQGIWDSQAQTIRGTVTFVGQGAIAQRRFEMSKVREEPQPAEDPARPTPAPVAAAAARGTTPSRTTWSLKGRFDYRPEVNACTHQFRRADDPIIGVDVTGVVTADVDLVDHVIVRSILADGQRFALDTCPNAKIIKAMLKIALFTPRYQEGRAVAVEANFWASDSPSSPNAFYKNHAAAAASSEAAEAKRRAEIAAKHAGQRAAWQKSMDELTKAAGVQGWLVTEESIEALNTNPYVWQRKTIGIPASFWKMESRGIAHFQVVDQGGLSLNLLVSGVPLTRFTKAGEDVLLAGDVQDKVVDRYISLKFRGAVARPSEENPFLKR